MKRQDTCGIMIKQLHDQLEKHANNELRPQNLTLTQMQALLLLFDTPGHKMHLKDMEATMHVAQSTAAGIISRLQKKGLVEPLEDPTDKRIKIVQLTAAGLECCQKTDSNIKANEAKFLSGLTETEQAIFLTLLRKLRDSIC